VTLSAVATACAAPRVRLVTLMATLVVVVVGCSSAEKPKPTPLEALTSQTTIGRKAWSVGLDNKVSFPIAPAVSGDAVALAAGKTIVVVGAGDGAERWRLDVGADIAAGTGSDGRRVAVVTTGNDVIVAEAGRVLWTQPLPTRVATAPLVAGERVFVLGVDRTIHAFDALDGSRLWSTPRPPGDALGLVNQGVLQPYANVLLAGQGPRMVLVDSVRGAVTREVSVATPRGTNEVERLADLVGPAARIGDIVCVRAFQASVGCIDAARGTLVWSKAATGSQGVGADAALMVAADAKDKLSAWKTSSGDTAWSHERLLHRSLSGVVVLPKAVVVGDVEGVLHFFDRDTGATLQQVPTEGGAVVGTPVLAGRTLVVVKRSGAVVGVTVD
jgi:outer membrane protein assembly factor BamB